MPTKNNPPKKWSSKTSELIARAQAMRVRAGMEGPDFVTLKMRVTGKGSLTKMTAQDIDAVIADLLRLYPDLAKLPAKRRQSQPTDSRARLWAKIDAQLYSLGKTRAYLDGRMRQHLGNVSDWAFADETILQRVIAALAYQQKRTGAATK